MKFLNVVIESIAYELPAETWTSAAVEMVLAPLYERLKLPFGRLELMTGILERRFWPKSLKPSKAASLAAEKLFDISGVSRDKVDMLINASVCRDRVEPSTAAYVHKNLQLTSRTQILDVSNACLGFLNAMVLAAGMIESGQIQSALIVSGENGRPLQEWTLKELLKPHLSRKQIKPFFANLTIGAGAVAAMITHKDLAPKPALSILNACVETDTSVNDLCEGSDEDGLAMQTHAEELLEAGIQVAKRAWNKFKKTSGWNELTPSRIICHQVGKQHLRRLYEALSLDISKDFSTFTLLGNIGSASLPITLAKSLESKALDVSEKIALLGIGSGLSSLMLALEYFPGRDLCKMP
ncbi:MAG: 3-oxoacyl-ACP synthase III [Verrucomicrobia bacterium GWF2_51_19]|nr:MAG: 3-oxoacyl-ACP synthase III [Verrucomicrobia bacterium GWF2_51_19]